MSASVTPAQMDTLRSIAHGSISSSYAAIGLPFAHPNRILKVINNTDGDMLFSFDAINDMDFVPSGGFTLYDLQSDGIIGTAGSNFYVKYSTAPTKGDVYVISLYAKGS